MHLHSVVKFKSCYLLFLLISASCTLNGATKSPSEHDLTQPPSIRASKDNIVLPETDESQAVSPTEQSQGISPRFTSIGTTPQLSASPPPEDANAMSAIGFGEVRSPNSSHADNPKNMSVSLMESDNGDAPIQVFVYNDEGVMPQTVALWEQAFAFLAGNFMLSFIKADTILSGKLNIDNCDLLIMPGGRATPFHQKLDTLGKEAIKKFVNSGGKCIGVGAGAYFLSARSTFCIPGSTCIEREGVGLSTVKAVGPFSPIKKTRFPSGGSAFQVQYMQEQYGDVSSFVFCNGGCVFENDYEVTVIAKTDSGHPVVVKQNDNIVLSGVHPEFSEEHWIPEASPFHKQVLTQSSRTLLVRILIELSLLKPLSK